MTERLPAVPIDLSELGARAAEFARASRAPATERAYRSDWADFSDWCASFGLDPLPADPATVGAYLTARAGQLKTSTLSRRIAAIGAAHRLAGQGFDASHPAIARVLSGIRRRYGSRQEGKAALLTEDLRRLIRALPPTLAGTRDRAVLLVGFAGAFRRSELVALDRVDIKVNTGGAEITIRRGKTDQEGRGREVGIPRSRKSQTCPVAALETWFEAAGIVAGPVFFSLDRSGPRRRLSGDAVAQIVKRAAARVGLDPAIFAGHSLRSGFATSAARGGADLAHIMQQTGHQNADVARRYVRAGNLLSNPASKAVRL
ncbi:MAG TPA: site-specific integrase [Stellaceae bacterium]|nr:site-specific integrase [Stellaceae bacterium]